MISSLLLAAGASHRFGAPKLLTELHGKPVIRWSAESLAGLADEMIVVVGADNEPLRRALAGVDVRFVVNERAGDGMASSIACGVNALSTRVDAVLVALGDEPMLPRQAHERVLERCHAGGPSIIAATYHGVRGHPVLFDRTVFAELAALSGDHGARAVVDRDPGRVAFVEMGEAHPVDVDTPEDLARLSE